MPVVLAPVVRTLVARIADACVPVVRVSVVRAWVPTPAFPTPAFPTFAPPASAVRAAGVSGLGTADTRIAGGRRVRRPPPTFAVRAFAVPTLALPPFADRHPWPRCDCGADTTVGTGSRSDVPFALRSRNITDTVWLLLRHHSRVARLNVLERAGFGLIVFRS
jgi:hypothetical protein